MNKTLPRVQFVLLVFIFLSLPLTSVLAQTAAPKLTAAQWQADLQFMADRMVKQHPNLFRRIKKEDFDAEVKALDSRIPSLSEDEIIVGFMKVVAMVRDGHTGLYPTAYFRSGIYPLKFYLYSDGLFIQKAAPEYAGLVGAKVVRIGNLSAEDAMKLTGTLAFSDNEMGAESLAPVFLSIPEILAGLKINESKQNLRLVVEVGGKEQTVQIRSALSFHQLFQPPSDWADAAGTAALKNAHGYGHNDFKIPLARRTLRAALAQATGTI